MGRRISVGLGLMGFPFSGAEAYWRWVDLAEAAGVDSIWGPRQYDPFAQNFNNLTMARAASVNNFENTSTLQIYIPGLDIVATAASYGVDAHEAHSSDEVFELVKAGIADRDRPTLINARTTPVSGGFGS